MNRDQVIHLLVAAEAQLRRTERLAASIGDATEHQHRIPPLIAATRRMLQRACSQIEQAEGRARHTTST